MKRRALLAALGGTAISARYTRAATMSRLGVLMSGAESSAENKARMAAFRQALAALGWRDGETIRIDYRWSAGRADLIHQYAEELVALRPDVILANSTPVISAVKSATTSIPVVFALAIDPVALGQVKSLAYPGGNLTGFTYINEELIGKWMELAKEIMPGTTRAVLVFDPATSPFYEAFVRGIDAARLPVAMELGTLTAHTAEELAVAVGAFARAGGGALISGPDPFSQVQINHLARLALRHRLPSVSVYRPFVTEGGLMAYGPDTADIFRRAAGYVDRILRGAKPADLPVQQPIKFEFSINRRTAATFGLTVPPELMAMADEVLD